MRLAVQLRQGPTSQFSLCTHSLRQGHKHTPLTHTHIHPPRHTHTHLHLYLLEQLDTPVLHIGIINTDPRVVQHYTELMLLFQPSVPH